MKLLQRIAIALLVLGLGAVSVVIAVGAWLPGHVAVTEVDVAAGPTPPPFEPGGLPALADAVDTPFAWWEQERGRRQTHLSAWMDHHAPEHHAYRTHTVGSIGIPLLLFRTLPEILPDRFQGFPESFGMHRSDDPDALLPVELSFGHGANPLAPVPGYDQVRMPTVALTCASCHVGHVLGPDGDVQELIGAPNQSMNIHAYYTQMAASVMDPRLTPASISAVLDAHPNGWAYGPGWENQERVDRLLLSVAGGMILDTMRGYIRQDEIRLDRTLVAHTYDGDAARFREQLVGQTELGLLLAILMPTDVWQTREVVPEAELAKWLPTLPAAVDYRHVWRQDQRTLGHYDGGVAAKPIRNIAAALGATTVPQFVHTDHALDATDFIETLPAPTYPFRVDATLAIDGKRVYDQACASCHDEEQLVRLDVIGTDPGRATAMTALGREALIAAIRVSCADEPACDEPDERVVKSVDEPIGYVAAPLTGVWATAPYLHNGSVPTLHHLLVPQERPAQFRRGREDYDTEHVGFGWDGTDGALWDTTLPGRSRAGHADAARFFGGVDFGTDVDARRALLEYLKTL